MQVLRLRGTAMTTMTSPEWQKRDIGISQEQSGTVSFRHMI